MHPEWPVVGHQPVVAFLRQSVQKKKTAHAYLFVGASQIGKATVAKHFAAALLCAQGSDGGWCDDCLSCHQRALGVHPDYHVIVPARATADSTARPIISLEQIKELQQRLSRRPVLAARTVAIINGAGLLNEKAANALLKTVEEPNPGTVIMLTCDAADQVPLTLQSRCQRLSLSAVPTAEIIGALRKEGVSHSEAERIAALAGGRPGLAFAYVQDTQLRKACEEELETFDELTRQAWGERFRLAAAWFQHANADHTRSVAESLRSRLEVWMTAGRDRLLEAAGCGHICQRTRGEIAEVATIDLAAVRQWSLFLDKVIATMVALQQNVNPRLAYELLLLDMPRQRRAGKEMPA